MTLDRWTSTAIRRYRDALRALKRHLYNHAWEPYLQQLTDTGVIVRWATKTGNTPTVHFCRADGQQPLHSQDKPSNGCPTASSPGMAAIPGHSRTIDALGLQLHGVRLINLEPNTRYCYAVQVNGKTPQTGRWFSFRTAPRAGGDTPFTFIVFGDYGNGTPGQRALRDQMRRDTFDLILTSGDNSQGKGRYKQLDATVFSIYRDIFSRAPVFPALGNHDYMTERGAPYLDLFDLPRNAWQAQDMERYYSFDYGNAHFTVLDSNEPLTRAIENGSSDNMLAWLRHDLSQTAQRWKIVICHHPPYNAGSRKSDLRVRTHVVPILEEHGVQLVFSGHQHNYQRSRPLRGGQVVTGADKGIVYIVSGAGATAKHACQQRDWLAFSICSASHGLYNRVKVSSEELYIEAIDDRGTVRDTCILS